MECKVSCTFGTYIPLKWFCGNQQGKDNTKFTFTTSNKRCKFTAYNPFHTSHSEIQPLVVSLVDIFNNVKPVNIQINMTSTQICIAMYLLCCKTLCFERSAREWLVFFPWYGRQVFERSAREWFVFSRDLTIKSLRDQPMSGLFLSVIWPSSLWEISPWVACFFHDLAFKSLRDQLVSGLLFTWSGPPRWPSG